MTYLRKADINDRELIYEWANDMDVRKASFNPAIISYDDHISWYEAIMKDDSVVQYILMDNDVPIGQIRLAIDGYDAEISYSVSSYYRGRGYAHKMIELINEEIRNNYSFIKRLIAKVKPNNSASLKLFESEGYQVDYICYSFEKMGGCWTDIAVQYLGDCCRAAA